MYAFWKYSAFPYVLGGKVLNGPNEKGLVQVEGYAMAHHDGSGFGGGWFDPIFLVQEEAGRELERELHKLRAERKDALNAVEEEFLGRLGDMVFPKMRKRIPQLRTN